MYALMESGYLYTLLVTVIGALLFTGKAALLPAELLKGSSQVFWIINMIAVTVGIEGLKAHIETYGFIRDIDMHRLKIN